MMKKTSLLLFLCVLSAAAFGQATETRKVSGITGIRASSVFEITVAKGATESLTLTADSDVLPLVRSEVRNGVLELSLDRCTKKNVTLKAAVTLKELNRVALSGACKLRSYDTFAPEHFTGALSGVASLQLTLTTGRLEIEMSGAGRLDLQAAVSGDASVDISGGANAKIALTAATLHYAIGGAARTTLEGAAGAASFAASGACRINAADFAVKEASVKISGAGRIDLHVTEALSVRASGASRIRYKGHPSSFDVRTAGASSLSRIEP
jgi:hypothetical protein